MIQSFARPWLRKRVHLRQSGWKPEVLSSTFPFFGITNSNSKFLAVEWQGSLDRQANTINVGSLRFRIDGKKSTAQ